MDPRSTTGRFGRVANARRIAWLAVGWLVAQPCSADAPITLTGPDEVLDDPPAAVSPAHRATSPGGRIPWGRHVSVQVNVDALGRNVLGDAANEPSIVVDPTDARRLAIAWRQFDSIASNFRQAGTAFSRDGGATWTFPGVLDPGVFRSDPVLDVDADGTFYLNSLNGSFTCDIFRSTDGGVTWDAGVDALGGDKQWMAIDRTSGPGRGHVYVAWYPFIGCCFPAMFGRSTDGSASFETPIAIGDGLRRGTMAVGADGAVYVTGHLPTDSGSFAVARSTSLADGSVLPAFDAVVSVDLGGPIVRAAGPNPAGLLGQIWVVADPSDADRIYVLASIDPPGDDPLDVHLVRSTDGGVSWSSPMRIHDDVPGAWQWFGTLSVAPDGRLDAVWNDTRGDPDGVRTVVYTSSSIDGGSTWSEDEPLTPSWDPLLGFPQQDKIGDYYQTISTSNGFHLAYAATFQGEQDIYYLYVPVPTLFFDGFESGQLDRWSTREIGRTLPHAGGLQGNRERQASTRILLNF
ncbi:MAG: sialidase family protein [Acidobacteriota bacterium]